MKRLIGLALAALLTAAAPSWAGFFCLNCGIHCMVPPPPRCPACDCPCDHGHHHCPAWKSRHAQELIEKLHTGDCCCRIEAAKKLGCRLHADFCCNPEVLDALIGALQCDPCWEVRRHAAWGIMRQHARTEMGVLALYLSSKLDPHYLVRDRAAEALGILTLGKQECYTRLLEGADLLIVELRKARYRPGSENCKLMFTQACLGLGVSATVAPPPQGPEPLPPPKPVVPPAGSPVTARPPEPLLPVPGTPLLADPVRR